MNKPIILHMCLSKGWGGLEMYPVRTGRELKIQGYKVYGLCIAGTRVAASMKEAGIETFEVSNKFKLALTQILSLNKWLNSKGIDLIHCHKSGDILIASLLNIIKKRKVIFTEHMGVTRPKKSIYHRWIYSCVDQVLSISNATLKRNLKALPICSEKISRLWLGTRITEQQYFLDEELLTLKKSLDIPKNTTLIGTLGRICDGKGQKELIRAFNQLAPSYPTINLIIVGGLTPKEGADEKYSQEIQDIISKSTYKDRIHLPGFRSDTDTVLAMIDIVCLPYRNEAFGLTAIESMAAKKAIVGANTGALPEILDGVAITCNPVNPKNIADSLQIYLDNPSLIKKNGRLARSRAEKEFSMSTHIERLLVFYNK